MTIVHSASLLPNREIHKETMVSVMKNAKNEHLGTGYSTGILLKVALSGSFSKVGQSTFNQRPYRRRYAQKNQGKCSDNVVCQMGASENLEPYSMIGLRLIHSLF